jgi:hypothetical protein
MFKFIKRLLGLIPDPVKTQEEVKAIFAPHTIPSEPKRAKDSQGKFLADNPATPENEAWVGGVAPSKKPAVNKVPAISESGAAAVAAATAPKPANKRRRPRNRNKVKPAVTEGKTKGGNGAVKPAQVAKAKPAAPKAPVKK